MRRWSPSPSSRTSSRHESRYRSHPRRQRRQRGRTLVDRRFILEAGRRDVAGRPMEYETAPEFLESFGLRSLADAAPARSRSRNTRDPAADRDRGRAVSRSQRGVCRDEDAAAEAASGGPSAEEEALISNSSSMNDMDRPSGSDRRQRKAVALAHELVQPGEAFALTADQRRRSNDRANSPRANIEFLLKAPTGSARPK